MTQPTTQERISNYAKTLRRGTIVTASKVVEDIACRNITTRGVGSIFKTMPEVIEMIPGSGHRQKWRRL